MGNNEIELIDIRKEYEINGKKKTVLSDINLLVNSGEFISIIGYSGCGKSTLIRMIAGLEDYNGGKIILDGEVTKAPDTRRGMIFQDHRLLPWINVYDNLDFGYYESDKKKKHENILSHLELVGLTDYKDAMPSQLSGGMSQRASIARALLHNPEVLLLDEPFGALDALTRIQMQKEVLRIWEQEKTTMIIVTHDIDEAIFLSERIVILEGNPATIKCIIPVEMSRPRNRVSPEFDVIRRKVYQEFFHESEKECDYII